LSVDLEMVLCDFSDPESGRELSDSAWGGGRPKAVTRQVVWSPQLAAGSLGLEPEQWQWPRGGWWGANSFYPGCSDNSLNKERRDLFLFQNFLHCHGMIKINMFRS